MYSQSIEEYKAGSQLSGDHNGSELASAMEQGFRSADWEGAVRNGIETAVEQRTTGNSSAYDIAALYAELGDKDQGFRWLTTSYLEHDTELVGLKTDASFDPIRSDPRFAELVQKVGLPQDGQLNTSEKQQGDKHGTQNPEAYELYLKGRSYLDNQTLSNLKTAVSYFNQAIAKDSNYALAYSGLARAYAFLPDYGDSPVEDHPKAMAAARTARELDPTLSEPHGVLGGQTMFQDWDIPAGVAEFKKAVKLDPNNARVHDRYAFNIAIIGGMEQEALAEINRAHQLDPASQAITYDLGAIHTYARRFDEAIAVCKKLADEHPTNAQAHDCLANAYWGKQMYSQVIEEYVVEEKLSHDELHAALIDGFRSGGWPGALTKYIEVLKAQRRTQPSSAYGSAYQIAESYAELSDKDQAFEWLNTAYQEHDEDLMGLKTDFGFDPIRSDPRFAELVRKMGLPQ
jgi:predicted Zn-dependent protease